MRINHGNTKHPSPIVAVQVVLVRREGDKETLQSVDIPIRNPLNADIELITDERGLTWPSTS